MATLPGDNLSQQENKVIPILPCPDIRVLVEFYRHLGFEVLGLYTSPNPYAALQLGSIELNFYGSRKVEPTGNSSMCFIKVANVDIIYNAFAAGLKKHTGKIPRSGIPRITTVRDLSMDRRFTLTDPGGNTLFIGTPIVDNTGGFFRTLQHDDFAKNFTVLYDVAYSKEDLLMAAKMLPKYKTARESLQGLDKAKFLLVELDIQLKLGHQNDIRDLKALLDVHGESDSDWKKIRDRYDRIIQEE